MVRITLLYGLTSWQAQLTVGSACGWWWTFMPDHPQHSLSHWQVPDSLIFAQDSEHVWHLELLFVWRVYRLLLFKDPLPTGIPTRTVTHHLVLPPAGNSPTKSSTFLSCLFLLLFLLSLSQKVPEFPHKEEFCTGHQAVVNAQALTLWVTGGGPDSLLLSADARICSPAVVLILLTFSGAGEGLSQTFCLSSAKIQSSWWEETLLG